MVPALLAVITLAADKPAALPAAWHGTWAGTMVVTGPTDKRTEVPVVLLIEPVKGSNAVTWKTTYDGSPKVVKDYKLVPAEGERGRFVVDEGNGIELAARLVDGVMYSTFEVGGAVLTARYELRDKAIRMEITSAKPAKAKTGGGQVQDHPVDVVQAAELKKQ